MSGKKLLRPAVGVIISAACLALVLRSVPLDQVGKSLQQANLIFLFPAVAGGGVGDGCHLHSSIGVNLHYALDP